MQTIAIVNHKGGTGKTTTTVNLAVALAQNNLSVIAIDLDPQGSLSYYLQAVQPYTISEALTGEVPLTKIVVNREGVDILPANQRLADIELAMVNIPQREYLIKQLFERIIGYDFLLVDCSPSLSLLTVNALTAVKKVIIPMQLEVLSLQGLSLILDTVFGIKEQLNPNLQILGILPVMLDKRKKVTSEILEYLKTNIGLPLFSPIHTDVKAIEAPSFGKSILSYAPSSISAQDYRRVAQELLQSCEYHNNS
ncbi:MAG: ParA family protein [Cytophagales bacterium]|nr:ParA family protein [Cytophagales bacterium]MDW8385340.1 ParA family protein [Flammeovirgaceae bacterium]